MKDSNQSFILFLGAAGPSWTWTRDLAREVNHRTYGPSNWEWINIFLFNITSASELRAQATSFPLPTRLEREVFLPCLQAVSVYGREGEASAYQTDSLGSGTSTGVQRTSSATSPFILVMASVAPCEDSLSLLVSSSWSRGGLLIHHIKYIGKAPSNSFP